MALKIYDLMSKKKLPLKKSKAGGKRAGSGRKGKFNEPTKPVAFKCPISKVDEFKEYCNNKLSEWSVKQRTTFSGLAKWLNRMFNRSTKLNN